jgi:uncharacterized delta-60 repeat protein
MGSFVALTASAGLVIACGDARPSELGATPDSGTTNPGNDSGSTTPTDAGPVPDAQTPAAITPRSTTRIANAINPYGLAFASDGFLYASGATALGADRKLAVWRFKDGALDKTFGTQGVITTDVPGDESSFDIVEVSAGNFVVHAVAGGKVYLVKLTKDGGGTFAFGTPVVVPFSWADGDFTAWPGTASKPTPAYSSWGIGLDKSTPETPKIVVFAAGAPAKVASGVQRIDNDRWIARVLADTLAPDPAFNGGAPLSVDADGKNLDDNGRRGIVLADGSIVSAGYTNFGQGLGNHVVLIRLKADGTVDPAFGFGTSTPGLPGQTKINPFVGVGGAAEAYGVVRQSSGRFVTGGYGTTHFDTQSVSVDLVSLGIKADGLDTTFGTLGAFGWQSEKDKSAGLGVSAYTDRARDLAILQDDRLVFAGAYDDYASLFVLDKNGTPDTSVGASGVLEYAYPAAFFKVTVSPDGKQMAATAQSLNQTADAGAPLGSILVTLEVGQ